jgi:hypothetical protein
MGRVRRQLNSFYISQIPGHALGLHSQPNKTRFRWSIYDRAGYFGIRNNSEVIYRPDSFRERSAAQRCIIEPKSQRELLSVQEPKSGGRSKKTVVELDYTDTAGSAERRASVTVTRSPLCTREQFGPSRFAILRAWIARRVSEWMSSLLSAAVRPLLMVNVIS